MNNPPLNLGDPARGTGNAPVRSDPLISVVTVTKNSAAHLPFCLASVAAQEGVSCEHWIVDGASADNTVDILRLSEHPRLHWISEPDSGIYGAMNKAVRLARGQWILFLGADDRLRPGILCEIAPYLRDPATLYYGDVWKTGRQIRDAGRFSQLRLALRNICQQAVFYPRLVFETHAFDEQYAIQADWVLNMACRQDGRFRFEYVPLVVTNFNDEDGISSRKRDLAIERDYTTLLRQHFPAWISWPLSATVIAWRWISRKKTP